MSILRPAGFNTPSVQTALSTRLGGPEGSPYGMNLSFNVGDDPENVRANRERFLKELGIREEELAIPRQIHSSTVLCVERPGIYPDCDGLITDSVRVFLTVTVADCIPLFLWEREKNVLAAVHSGWRGTVAGISLQAVKKMVEEFGARPGAMRAHIGPCASVCCYTVSQDVASRFDPRFVREIGGQLHVDLKGTVMSQLLEAGIPPAGIDISPLCTISEAFVLHSYRRDGVKSGRMMGITGRFR